MFCSVETETVLTIPFIINLRQKEKQKNHPTYIKLVNKLSQQQVCMRNFTYIVQQGIWFFIVLWNSLASPGFNPNEQLKKRRPFREMSKKPGLFKLWIPIILRVSGTFFKKTQARLVVQIKAATQKLHHKRNFSPFSFTQLKCLFQHFWGYVT